MENDSFARCVQHLRQTLPGLMAVYLFGSHGQEMARPDSDLDLAILVEGNVQAVKLWQLAEDLALQVGCDIDLVDLRAASTVMQFQILTTGQRMWQRDGQAALFESCILSEYTDLQHARAGLLADIVRKGRIYG